jgi:UDP-glucose 4-epimerase
VLPGDVDVRLGDISDLGAVEAAIQNVSAVIHLAALLHVLDSQKLVPEEFERINLQGTRNVVSTMRRANVGRLVFFGTIAVYGYSGDRILNEDAPAQPETLYGKTKLAAEKVVLAASGSDDKTIGTVLRLGAVYGPRVKGNYRRLLKSLAGGGFIPLGSGGNVRTLIYDQDVARAAVLAMRRPEAAGRIYNVTDGKFHSLNEIIAAMCHALGRTPPRISLPVRPVRAVAGLLEDGARLIGRSSPVTRDTIDKYIEDVRADSTRIQEELGFVPQTDLATGWQKTVAELRKNGEI